MILDIALFTIVLFIVIHVSDSAAPLRIPSKEEISRNQEIADRSFNHYARRYNFCGFDGMTSLLGLKWDETCTRIDINSHILAKELIFDDILPPFITHLELNSASVDWNTLLHLLKTSPNLQYLGIWNVDTLKFPAFELEIPIVLDNLKFIGTEWSIMGRLIELMQSDKLKIPNMQRIHVTCKDGPGIPPNLRELLSLGIPCINQFDLFVNPPMYQALLIRRISTDPVTPVIIPRSELQNSRLRAIHKGLQRRTLPTEVASLVMYPAAIMFQEKQSNHERDQLLIDQYFEPHAQRYRLSDHDSEIWMVTSLRDICLHSCLELHMSSLPQFSQDLKYMEIPSSLENVRFWYMNLSWEDLLRMFTCFPNLKTLDVRHNMGVWRRDLDCEIAQVDEYHDDQLKKLIPEQYRSVKAHSQLQLKELKIGWVPFQQLLEHKIFQTSWLDPQGWCINIVSDKPIEGEYQQISEVVRSIFNDDRLKMSNWYGEFRVQLEI